MGPFSHCQFEDLVVTVPYHCGSLVCGGYRNNTTLDAPMTPISLGFAWAETDSHEFRLRSIRSLEPSSPKKSWAMQAQAAWALQAVTEGNAAC